MAHGIDIFKTYFADYKDQYVVIGGMACDCCVGAPSLAKCQCWTHCTSSR